MTKQITIGELHEIYQKYGDLCIKVDTPYGFKDIEWCGITEINADVYRCELEDGKYVEGADYHRLKKEDGDFVVLKDIELETPIQTIDGISKVKSIKLMDFKDTLYDIQVAEVHQYYSNGIVSHNTTLTIDAMKFLLHGNTTKTDKNEEIFNTYSGKNDLTVRGCIEIDGTELIIERKMRRSAKKGGGWTITNKLNYYNILPDGEEKLQNEEDAKTTTVALRKSIGSEKDFEMLVLATESNLDDLIGLSTTESGKILTRLIGLEIIELKEAAVRTMYNDFAKKKKSNVYSIISLTEDIEQHSENIIKATAANKDLTDRLTDTKNEIGRLNAENDNLLNSKEKIDVTITALNPEKLESDIKEITDKGTALKNRVEVIVKEIADMGVIVFDEDKYQQITKSISVNDSAIAVIRSEISNTDKIITQLIEGGICQACNRALDDVDNTAHIESHRAAIVQKQVDEKFAMDEAERLYEEIIILNKTKDLIDKKNRLELDKDRLEVEMGALRNQIVSKKNDLKKYNLNLGSIDLNRRIDGEVALVKTKLNVAQYAKDDAISKIEKLRGEVEALTLNISTKTDLISKIKKEDEIDKIFKIYIELVGKKGISKLVLRSVLPIINSELSRLLDDVCDFEIEIFMDDKNDVSFMIIKDNEQKLLKSGSGLEKTASSLALRCVLGKLSTLPMPNFITFDEVLGRVANENIEKLKPLFDKIKNMYEMVFLITHNDLVKDWSDNVITVEKSNNISKITLK